jgi:tetrahydromethanopterin S-methyltransferase subunit H
MSLKEFRCYMISCKIHNIIPTWSGLKRFKEQIRK